MGSNLILAMTLLVVTGQSLAECPPVQTVEEYEQSDKAKVIAAANAGLKRIRND